MGDRGDGRGRHDGHERGPLGEVLRCIEEDGEGRNEHNPAAHTQQGCQQSSPESDDHQNDDVAQSQRQFRDLRRRWGEEHPDSRDCRHGHEDTGNEPAREAIDESCSADGAERRPNEHRQRGSEIGLAVEKERYRCRRRRNDDRGHRCGAGSLLFEMQCQHEDRNDDEAAADAEETAADACHDPGGKADGKDRAAPLRLA